MGRFRLGGAIALGAAVVLGGAAPPMNGGDWLHYGNDPGGTRFSAVRQITPANVRKLRPAWVYRLPPTQNPFGRQFVSFEATPLKVGDGLYFCAPDNKVIALDAETGRARWIFDPRNRKWSAFRVCRGVAYHHAARPGGECPDRIITGTTDARLIALDLRTGRPCRGFGERGAVDLLVGMGRVAPGGYGVTSAPTIIGDVAVIGGSVTDNGKADDPSGVIRAFDVTTGKLVWAWDMGQPGRRGLRLPGQYTRDTPNGWAPFSADPALNLVFVPTGNSNPDNYGARRTASAEKYATSVVALDAATGEPRWSFQTVHHDLWDYDSSSQPVLVDFPTPGGPVPAVIAATKRGELFVLDRRNGRPLTPVVERPVPQGGGRGDRTAPTQPFSIGMPSFVGPPVTERSMWGLTPLDQLWCRIQFRRARNDGLFTPPTDGRPWIYSPGWMGGMDWSSVSVDPRRGVMVATTMHIASYDRFVTQEEAKRDPRVRKGMTPQDGSPYAGVITDYFHSPLGVPCQEPPYGRLNAVDLRTRKLLWSMPLGTAQHGGPLAFPSLHVPFAIPMGTVTMGGNIVTASGLTFIGASLDRQFRAIDTLTGRELWAAPLEAPAFATPVTYVSPRSGRQFVAVAVGGFSKYGPNAGLYLAAFAIPRG